jgi:hypothetical protein
MTTVSTHPTPTTSYDATYGTTDDDTLRLPLRTPARPLDRRPTGLVVDATRLWTGGIATAAVAALVALVGTLVVRVLFQIAPLGTHGLDATDTGMLCLVAAVAALAATGIAHLLVVSTPEPLSYLGWIIGLSTTAAVVLPLVGATTWAVAVTTAVLHLVIGMAIGSLVVGATAAALQPAIR